MAWLSGVLQSRGICYGIYSPTQELRGAASLPLVLVFMVAAPRGFVLASCLEGSARVCR